jgi:hypothetical protein
MVRASLELQDSCRVMGALSWHVEVAVCSVVEGRGCHLLSGCNARDHRAPLRRLGAVAAPCALLRRTSGDGEPDHPRRRQGSPPQWFHQPFLHGPDRWRDAGHRNRHVRKRAQRDRRLIGGYTRHGSDHLFRYAVCQRDDTGNRTVGRQSAAEFGLSSGAAVAGEGCESGADVE